eukprot:jgi/Undpi1/11644/HiC_scaffold_36.g13939.m1
MGLFKKIASAMGNRFRGNMRILVVGLDNSGKSTLIEHIKPTKATTFEPTPTVGFQVQEFAKNNINFTVFDMSGQSRYRTLWEHYFCDVHAIIFVVDSTDRVRMCVAKEELEEVLRNNEVRASGLPILVYANKGDLPGSMTPHECANELGLSGRDDEQTPWHIERSNAIEGSGVEEGINWLIEKLQSTGGEGRRGKSDRNSASGSEHK